MTRDYAVCVTWDQFENGAWHLRAHKPLFFSTFKEADALWTEQHDNNGYLDPGRDDIRSVEIELRHNGRLIKPADVLCTSERNSFSLAEVTKALASRREP